VIAQTKGGDQDNVLAIGSHTDSVAAGPGINDNGSGTIALIEIALAPTKFKTNNAIRFLWFSAEEFGLLGSEYYVAQLSQEERNKIRLYLNFDMIASPNYIYGIYDGDGSAFGVAGPPGSAEAEKLFEDYFKNEAGLNSTATDFSVASE
jgi:carboxypeptidase Q